MPSSPFNPFLHAMSQLLDLLGLLKHVDRQNIFIRLANLLFKCRRQRQQFIRIFYQPFLPLNDRHLLLFDPLLSLSLRTAWQLSCPGHLAAVGGGNRP